MFIRRVFSGSNYFFRVIIVVLLSILSVSAIHAETQFKPENPKNNSLDNALRLSGLEHQYRQSELNYSALKQGYETLAYENQTLSSSLISTQQKLEESSEILRKLSNDTNELELKFKYKLESENQFGSWTSILLACVALILTALGLGIAILALLGKNAIQKAATDAAVTKSESVIREQIDDGSFNEVVYAAVDRAIYRGILSDQDFAEGDEGSDDESK